MPAPQNGQRGPTEAEFRAFIAAHGGRPSAQDFASFQRSYEDGTANLQQRALDQSQGQYDARQPFRDAAFQSLTDSRNAQPWDYGSYNPEQAYQSFQPITNNYQQDPSVRAAFNRTQQLPDRLALTRQSLADMDAAAAPELAHRFQAVGQAASTLGRLGSGQVTTDLGNIESDYERNRILAENASVRDATSASIGDRYQALDAAQSLDNTNYGRSRDATQLATQQQGFRNQLGQDSLQARIARWQAQNGVRNQGIQNAESLGGFGFGGDPTATYLAVADRRQAQANYDQQQNQSSFGDLASLGGYLLAGPAGGTAGQFLSRAMQPQPRGAGSRGSGYGDYQPVYGSKYG